jgi:hypothetical protein
MAQGQISLKRVGVDKANARIVMVSAGAAFLSVFFIISSIALFSQIRYQNKVISQKKVAVKQLDANLKARDELVDKYKAFVAAPQNILQGNPDGTGPADGSNAKLVLDSLPSKYDFPALTSSIEKLVGEHRNHSCRRTGQCYRLFLLEPVHLSYEQPHGTGRDHRSDHA